VSDRSLRPGTDHRRPKHSEFDLLGGLGWGKGVRRAWRLLRGNRILAALQSVLFLLVGLSEAAILTLFARIALIAVTESSDHVAMPLIGAGSIGFTFVVLAVLIMIRLVVGSLIAVAIGQLQFRVVTTIRSEIVGAYSKASWRSQADLDEGGLQQIVVALPNKASGSVAGLLKNAGDIFIMAAMLSYAVFTDHVLTLALIVAVLTSSLAFLPFRRFIKSRSADVIRKQRELSSATTELSAMKFELQAFGVGQRFFKPVRDLIIRGGRVERRLSIVKAMVVPLYTTLTYSAVALGLMILQGSTSDGLNQVGPILLVVLRSLAYGQAIQQAAIGIASLMPILDFLQSQLETLQSNQLNWGDRSLDVVNSVQLEDVSFAYVESDGTALRGASVLIARGERVGIVGPSGSGKSTLTRLMLGIVRADTGQVLVNHSPLHEYDRDAWSGRVGVVPQSAQVLRGSLADNLRMYRDGISDEDLWWALEVADLAAEVRLMPDALATEIGAGTRTLSGGQQQRLAIARAFATRPDLVVMDEPTSSIDAMSEAAVSDAIERLPEDVTVIIVSHRMRILQGCDRLIVVEGGQITANGPSSEVLYSSPYLLAARKA